MTPELAHALDLTKMGVLLSNSSLFFGSIAGKLMTTFDERIAVACVGSRTIRLNPTKFLEMTKLGRAFTYTRQIQHVARLHAVRRGNRDYKVWGIACDIVVNQWMLDNVYPKTTTEDLAGCILVHDEHREYTGMSEEDVYEEIKELDWSMFPDGPSGGYNPMDEDAGPMAIDEQIRIVTEAQEVARMGGASGDGITQGAMTVIGKYLKPKVPWQNILQGLFRQLSQKERSWQRPHRRSMAQGVYRPSVKLQASALDHIVFYHDLSGSVRQIENHQVFTEMCRVKAKYQPEQMTMVGFNDAIVYRTKLNKGQGVPLMTHITSGGTWLGCVADDIETTKPTCVVIFSDLDCAPMRDLNINIPIIWVVFGEYDPPVPYGKKVHIGEIKDEHP